MSGINHRHVMTTPRQRLGLSFSPFFFHNSFVVFLGWNHVGYTHRIPFFVLFLPMQYKSVGNQRAKGTDEIRLIRAR